MTAFVLHLLYTFLPVEGIAVEKWTESIQFPSWRFEVVVLQNKTGF